MTVGVEQRDFRQLGCGIHFLEHVEIIVAGTAICTKTHADAVTDHRCYGCDTGGPVSCCLSGFVHDFTAKLGEKSHILVVQVNAMKGDESRVQVGPRCFR